MKIAGGFIGGLIVGLIGVIVTMHVLSSDVTDKQAAAYDEGLKRGLEMATADMGGEGVDIGGALNQGLVDDNERMRRTIDDVRLKLQVLQSRDDLPQDARDQVAEMINSLD